MNNTIFIIKPIKKSTINKIHILVLVLLSISSCMSERTKNTDLHVVSLKEQLPLLQEQARNWDQKAYLYSVEIPIFYFEKENNLWLIEANFRSIDKPRQSVTIRLEVGGEIHTQYIQHPKPIPQFEPTLFDDGLIDSEQAMKLFVSDEVVRALKANERSSLFLELDNTQNDQRVVWRLSLAMDLPQSKHFFIDAFTGEELKIIR